MPGQTYPQQPMMNWKELRNADDSLVIEQLQAGNHDALAVIIDRYQRLVLSVAERIVKSRNEAEEVVQTVFLEIFRNAAQFDLRRGTLKVWLLQWAYSRSINHRDYLERRKYYAHVEVEEVEATDGMPAPLSRLSSAETACVVHQAFRSLNERQAKAIELMHFEGLTAEEAAEKTGETPGAMRHRYYRGLMKLRKVMQQRRHEEQHANKLEQRIELEVADADPRPI